MARPRKFDETEVLDRAMRLFWEQGYEGMALSDLLEAVGLTKSSFYKAFASKEALFDRVRARYDEAHLGFRRAALAEPTPRRIVARLLTGMIDLHAGESTPRGCLTTNAVLACSPESEAVRLVVARERDAFRELLRARLEAVGRSGSFPAGWDADTTASVVQTMIQGLAVQAKGGAERDELERVVTAFLAAWPDDTVAGPG